MADDGYKYVGNRKIDTRIKSVRVKKKRRKKMLENILKGNDNRPRTWENDARNEITGEYVSPPGKFDVRDLVEKTNTINKREASLKKMLKRLKK